VYTGGVTRRTACGLAAGLLTLGLLDAQQPTRFELDEVTVAQLQESLTAGRYTSRRLVDLYSRRIEQIDRSGPALRSILELNPDAASIADALDAERRAGKLRGPLHGIPVIIKDNIDTADNMMTTAGSLALDGSIAPRDAFIVARLRAAGAVILGKRAPTFSTATRAVRAPGPPPRSPPTSPLSASAPRPTAPSCAPRRPTAS
jgi:Asp-tRNA(Asn)/Glu-tRNA(Gln) amidotransferase A subunit family amidase